MDPALLLPGGGEVSANGVELGEGDERAAADAELLEGAVAGFPDRGPDLARDDGLAPLFVLLIGDEAAGAEPVGFLQALLGWNPGHVVNLGSGIGRDSRRGRRQPWCDVATVSRY